ncbi:hypothetical protein VCRA2119O147_560045 [Vibrio crassostreae]|nr:hypothetical protein VCRA2118O236_390037 [Vibrio crassostreae]CAK2101821.1 hypothetical protein VCRA2116O234_410029 [Vibrio crassostreae]CAK2372893.1 hypothetical protein VCRA2119O147_560045 [Vibrio crassostreae]CAK2914351.1 hypothetical protein VCRA2110O183_420057 [Vibrio crassostreae]CAK3525875.1 hypothetical protein VCRA2128O309_700039 [Vibrio crassostreae]
MACAMSFHTPPGGGQIPIAYSTGTDTPGTFLYAINKDLFFTGRDRHRDTSQHNEVFKWREQPGAAARQVKIRYPVRQPMKH